MLGGARLVAANPDSSDRGQPGSPASTAFQHVTSTTSQDTTSTAFQDTTPTAFQDTTSTAFQSPTATPTPGPAFSYNTMKREALYAGAPVPETPVRRRDVFKRRAKKTGIVIGAVLAVPLLPAIAVVGGIGFVAACGAESVHSCFTEKAKGCSDEEVEANVHTVGWGSRNVAPPTPKLPHHNYGCNARYERYVETIQEHSILVSEGKMDPSEAILG